jgi:hypothetical protein
MEPDDTVGRASAMATRVGGIRRIGPFGRNLFCFIRECFYFFFYVVLFVGAVVG